MNVDSKKACRVQRRRNLVSVLSAAGLAAALPAHGQEPVPDTAVPDDGALYEVLVTAERSNNVVQKVPLAVSAIDGQQLEKSGTQTLADIAATVPGLAITSPGIGSTRMTIRGLSTSGNNFLTQPTVGYYIDDTPITLSNTSHAGQFDSSFFDIARVEVLRGPQGTLYGAGSLGGTVKLIFNQPDLETFDGRTRISLAQVKGASDPGYGFDGVVNLPLVEDKLAMRLVAGYKNEPGYIDHTFFGTGVTKKDVNSAYAVNARALMLWKISDNLSITGSYMHQSADWDGKSTYDLLLGKNKFRGYYLSPGSDELDLSSLTINAQLGSVSLTSNTAYYDRKNWRINDSSESATRAVRPTFTTIQPGWSPWDTTSTAFSHETRLNSDPAKSFGWSLGVFASEVKSEQIQPIYLVGSTAYFNGTFNGIDIIDDKLFDGFTNQTAKQKAAFGEASYAFDFGLKLTAGLRYYDTNVLLLRDTAGVLVGVNGRLLERLPSEADGTVSRFVASYTFDSDRMIYASASEGFRLGGGNVYIPPNVCAADLADLGLTEAPLQFDSDSVMNYELGFKSMWANRRIRANIAVYHIDWTDIQQANVLTRCGRTFIGNASKAVSKGVELEAAWRMTTNASVGLAMNLSNAEFTTDDPFVVDGVGERLLESPEKTGSVFFEYARPISHQLSLSTKLDASYYGDVRQSLAANARRPYRPSYELVNLRFGIESERWEAVLTVNNLLDEVAYLQMLPTTLTGLYVPIDTAQTLRPRTIGVFVTRQF